MSLIFRGFLSITLSECAPLIIIFISVTPLTILTRVNRILFLITHAINNITVNLFLTLKSKSYVIVSTFGSHFCLEFMTLSDKSLFNIITPFTTTILQKRFILYQKRVYLGYFVCIFKSEVGSYIFINIKQNITVVRKL